MKYQQLLRFTLLGGVIIAALGTGCSGINASKSVSPLDFLMPGLHIQNSPPLPVIPSETNSLPLLAQASPLPL
jgi:hypothetical protein